MTKLQGDDRLYVRKRASAAENNRRFVNAVLWVVRSGMHWADLPERYGKYKSVHKRFVRGSVTLASWQQLRVCRVVGDYAAAANVGQLSAHVPQDQRTVYLPVVALLSQLMGSLLW